MAGAAASAWLFAATAAAVGAISLTAPRLPGPAPQGRPARFDVAAENAACESCHGDIAAEWRGSNHKRAWQNRAFQNAYALEPQRFCRNCHAPEADPAKTPSEASQHVGVGCVSCHLSAGDVAGTHGLSSSASHHAVRAEPRLATAEACQSCHQFDFQQPQDAAMQGTVVEHSRSRYSGAPCQECHMPTVRTADGRTHRSHTFAVRDDPQMLRAAVTVQSRRLDTTRIEVAIAAARIGHDFPTGDMFRRVVVRARSADASMRAATVVLARRFAMLPSEHGVRRIQIGDDRVKGNGSIKRVVLHFDRDVLDRSIHWELAYQRMPPAMASTFGIAAADNETVFTSGTLPRLVQPTNAAATYRE